MLIINATTEQNKLTELKEIEALKLKKLREIKLEIAKHRGNTRHKWEFISIHHGWTFWYKCRLCGKIKEEDRNLTKQDKNEECRFFIKHFIPNIWELEELIT